MVYWVVHIIQQSSSVVNYSWILKEEDQQPAFLFFHNNEIYFTGMVYTMYFLLQKLIFCGIHLFLRCIF